MLFNTAEYILFFIVVTVVYFTLPKRIRYIWLLAASYFFYMNWSVKYSLLLLSSTLVTWLSSLLIDKYRNNIKLSKTIVTVCIVFNLALLGVFKYTTFILDNINKIIRVTGKNGFDYIWNFALPVGISFYIFQALSYTVDVYRKDVQIEKNFLKYALFVSFFPQLVAGPIERSSNLLRQIQNIHKESCINFDRMIRGTIVVIWGLFMKMVIADRIAIFVDAVFDKYYLYGSVELILATIGFAIQIYCDFAGYSTIAIGSAEILGFSLMDNFKAPYLSGSVKEFWRRWHISLSTWFRDYLYIPLGGSRCSVIKKYMNIFITMSVSGLWHGTNWSYVVWGGLHGIYQIVEDSMKNISTAIVKKYNVKTNVFSFWLLKRVVTFILVDFAWIFFRASGVREAANIISRIFTRINPWVLFDKSLYNIALDYTEVHILVIALFVMLLVDAIQYVRDVRIDEIVLSQNLWFKWLFIVVFITVIWVLGIYGPAFNSSQFIYFQF